MKRSTLIVLLALTGCAHKQAAPGPSAEATKPEAEDTVTAPAQRDLEAGKKLYNTRCAGCHGPTGKGNGENAVLYSPPPRDFTAGVIKNTTDETLYREIRHGKGDMLPFEHKLSDGETWNVIAYVRTLQQ